jgi:hypothetical protein
MEPRDIESYQPPQVTVLGSVTELTSGIGGGAFTDPGQGSIQ